jgi:hypothetical protein
MTGWWGVFSLFLIPWGGGIPAGVLLAKHRGIAWPVMMGLYFVSDWVLACVFEPCMRLLIAHSRTRPRLNRFKEGLKAAVKKTTDYYGSTGSPFALIMIAFGVDPMTGRAAAHAAGHGFVSGWLIAIAGDMIYFTLIMATTLWLSGVLGDGKLAMFIILVLMLVAPAAIRRTRRLLGA